MRFKVIRIQGWLVIKDARATDKQGRCHRQKYDDFKRMDKAAMAKVSFVKWFSL